MVSIYVLIDNFGQPFYVGATANKLKSRLFQHLREAYKVSEKNTSASKRRKYIKDILDSGDYIGITTISVVDIVDARRAEAEYYNKLIKMGFVLLQKESAPYNEPLEKRIYSIDWVNEQHQKSVKAFSFLNKITERSAKLYKHDIINSAL